MSGLFGGLAGVSSKGGSSDFFPLGTHIVELEDGEGFISQAKNRTVRIRGKVVESDNPDIQIGQSFVQIMTKGNLDWQVQYFQRDLKGFLEAVIHTVAGQTAEDLISEEGISSPEEEDTWWAASASDIFVPDPTPQDSDHCSLNKEYVGLRLKLIVVKQHKRRSEGTFEKSTWSRP